MPGRRHHRVVDGDDAERGERLAAHLDHVEFGDLLFQRAAGEQRAEYRLAEAFRRRFFFQPLGAGVLVLLVAPDAVVRLVQRPGEIGARIGEREAVAMAQVLEPMLREATAAVGVHRHEAHVIELLRRLEQHARAMLRLARGRGDRPGRVTRGKLQLPCVRRLVLQPRAHLAREVELGGEPGCRRIELLQIGRLHLVHGAPLHELALHRIQRRKLVVACGERARLGFDAEELGDEIFYMRRERDEQLRFRGAGGRLRAGSDQLVGERAIGFAEVSDEGAIEPNQALALVQVGEADAEAKLHEVRIIVEFFPAFPYSPGSTRCRSRTASSSSPVAPPVSAPLLRAWRRRTAARW